MPSIVDVIGRLVVTPVSKPILQIDRERLAVYILIG